MDLSLNRFILLGAILALTFSAPALADDLTEQDISVQDFPPSGRE